MEQLSELKAAIKILEGKVNRCKNDSYFIFEHQKNILLKDICFEVKKTLVKLFGDIKTLDKYGIFQELFYADDVGYNKGVMFSYWSFFGVPYNSSKTKDGAWRYNLYYKGSRYSKSLNYDNFYDIFNVLSKECQNAKSKESNAPIDHITRLLLSKTNSKQCVVFGPRNKSHLMEDAICIPTIESFRETNFYDIEKLKSIIIDLDLISHLKDKCIDDSDRSKIIRQLQKTLNDNLVDSFVSLYNMNNSLLHVFADELSDKLSVEYARDEKEEYLKNIFYLIICYQLYDHDGVTLIFVPENKDPQCCLVLLLPFENGRKALEKDKDFFLIINTLSKLPIIEKDIHSIVKNNIVKKDIWKSHYLCRYELFESLCLHFKILMKYICRNNGIKTVDISFRVKEFDSFFNRAIDRFNDPAKFHILGDEIGLYRESFLSGDEGAVDIVLSKFWDISGIRILCVFSEDLREVFYELCVSKKEREKFENKDLYLLPEAKQFRSRLLPSINKRSKWNDTYLINVNYIDKKTEDDYRADHYILSLGHKREKHPELSELKDLKCEVQVKTTLSQGWSEADHDLIYKSELSQSQIKRILAETHDIGKKRKKCSERLDDIDKDFDGMRKQIKCLLDED